MVNATTTIKTNPGWTTISIDSPDAVEEMAKAFKARTPRLMLTGDAKSSRNRHVPQACYMADVCQLTLKPGLTPSSFLTAVRRHKKTYDARAELLVLEDFENWESATLKVVASWARERSVPIIITLDLEGEHYADAEYLAKQLSKLSA